MAKIESRVSNLEKQMAPGMPRTIGGWWGLGGFFYSYAHGRDAIPMTPEQVEEHEREQAEAAELHDIPAVVVIRSTTMDEMKEYWKRMGIEGAHFDELVAKYEAEQEEKAEHEREILRAHGLST